MSGSAQQYCLRWNNHRSNLLTVFDELLQNGAFTDVTLACDGGTSVKCHKMVLAACSSYFQTLFTELPCRHPVVVLKDVKYSEIKAILEYMYRGEVNVAQNQLAALLKVAEALKVKGLVEENQNSTNNNNHDQSKQHYVYKNEIEQHSPPTISTSSPNIQSAAHSSSSSGSPPHSTALMNGPTSSYTKNPYGNIYSSTTSNNNNNNKTSASSNLQRNNRLNMPMWPVPGMPLTHPSSGSPQTHPHAAATAAAAAAATMLSSCYDAAAAAAAAATNADMSPLRRKKLSSLLMNRDTPILRTVLGQGQGQPDSSQPMSLVCHPDSHENVSLNGTAHDSYKSMKNEPSEDAQSPYTDISFMDEEEKSKMAIPSSSPLSFTSGDNRKASSRIVTYVPQQRPDWKRYKQYTPTDIMSAIEEVRNGVSALQAARNYGVPSRTLYDKVKKLGITTSRPFKRGSNGSSRVCFPYGLSGTSSPRGGHTSEGDDPNHSSLLEASFLQHAFDRSGSSGGDVSERDALAAMAAAAAHHAAATSLGDHSMNRSPSPSPSLKYMRPNSMTPSPAAASDMHHSETNGSSERDVEDEDQVEDLSMARKSEPPQQSRVIMPPMNQVSTIIKKEEGLREETSRPQEVPVQDENE